MDTIPSFAYQRFESRADAQSAFDTALESANRSVRMFDRDGEFYGLDRPQIAEHLNNLLRQARDTKVTIIVQRAHFLQRDCPRLLQVLQAHAPRFEIRKLAQRHAGYERGFVLIDNSVILRRPHFDQVTTYWDVEETQIAGSAKLFAELVENSETAISASVTGL